MFERLTATVLSAPEASTAASRLAIASNVFGAGRNVQPGLAAQSAAAIRWGNSACVLIPVPTAVPPIGSSAQRAARSVRAVGLRAATCDGVAREFLAQPDRHGVLKMGPADLDDAVERPGPLARAIVQVLEAPGSSRLRILQVPRRESRWGSRRWTTAPCSRRRWDGPAISPPRTPSLNCSLAMPAITSLVFMFVEVPLPVWKMSTTNWSSCLPSATACAAWTIGAAEFGGKQAAGPC